MADILQSTAIHCALILATIAIVANICQAGELKWRSGRTAMSKASRPVKSTAEQQFMRPRLPRHRDDVPVSSESSTNTKSATKADATKELNNSIAETPRTRTGAAAHFDANSWPDSATNANQAWDAVDTGKVDPSVKQAAFEDEGPQISSGAEGQARLRSVIVDSEEQLDFTRSAQLPSTDTSSGQVGETVPPATNNQTELDSQLEEELRLPFGEPNGAGRDATGANRMRQPADGQAPDTFPPPTAPGGTGVQPLDDDVPIASPTRIEADREASDEDCTDSLSKLRAKTIDTVNLSIAVSGTEGEDFPFECAVGDEEWHGGRSWDQTTFLWKASALCHKPLYFEDPQLERYGHSFPPCCQPLISGAHFFTRLPILPYCMGVEPPMECIYSLGHYRPGSCAPYMFEPIPISYRGALFQAGAVVGAAAALP